MYGSVVDISEVDGKLLELLIQYNYTDQICIDSDNVLNILAAAHQLELDEVKHSCFKLLESCMILNNCITILVTSNNTKILR